jgi:ATP phosphoribosyltransferase
VDGYPVDAKIDIAYGLAFDSFTRKLILTDSGNHAVRLVDVITGEITTYIGHGMGFSGINGTEGGYVEDTYLTAPFSLCIDKFGNCNST